MNYEKIIKSFQINNKKHASALLKSSVLVPIITVKNELHILFEVRSHQLKSQPGEICFPGGKVENNETLQTSALRETVEELNIDTNNIQIIGKLDPVITMFNMIIYPYCGILHNIRPEDICYNKTEVASIFTVPIKKLLQQTPLSHKIKINISPNEDFPFHLIQEGKKYNWKISDYDVYFYQHQQYVIWGITAKILKNFLEIIQA
ncbi:NUDIX hydrolase [Clostridium formicaceticum]|uniref:Coenzyme A pyrophosphatase n=1 Tax=Clostridium formicaceticum TaxID=1497 RepID=A0AAC9WGN6_9CLOT|nr:CoA pyrophosphatase [Clostridium formicaceticum]AOY77447.1 coenzyme A pyrophosphatase [Clostridium formicaceticum]ARE88004.1 putative NUDIX hydrolase [Clostridium formicaceticum]